MLKTAGKHGALKKRITVTSNDPAKKDLILEIQGEVIVDISVEPRDLAFKQLAKGEAAEREVTIKATEPDKTKIESVTLESPSFSLEKISGDFATESKWRVKFKGASELGPVKANLVIAYTTTEPQKLEVPIRLLVQGDLLYPKTVRFAKAPSGEVPPRNLQIRSRSGKTVSIKKVEDPDGLLKTEITIPKGEKTEVKLTVLDPSKEITGPHTLRVLTSDADEPVVEVSYSFGVPKRGPKPNLGDNPAVRLKASNRIE